MKFICFHRWNDLPRSADKFFEQSERDSIFLTRTWLETLTNHSLTAEQSLLLACVVSEDQYFAVLPLLKHPQGGLSTLSNRFTTLSSLLVKQGTGQDAVFECLAQGLSELSNQSIRFEPIDPNDKNMARLQKAMEANRFLSYPYFRFYNWTHPVTETNFADYMAQRPTHLRNTIQRKSRKLEREHQYTIRMYQDDDIDQALRDYNAVYQASWKANEFFSDFTPNLVRAFSKKGWLRLAVLYVEQQPIAAQIWFVMHSKASIYRLVYNENWKRYSPGSILTQYMMRHAIDIEKVTHIDFLTGNEAYKRDWMTLRNDRIGIRFAKRKEETNQLNRAMVFFKKQLSL